MTEFIPEILFLAPGDFDELGGGHPGHGAVDDEEGLEGDVHLALAEPLAQEQRPLVLQLQVQEGGLTDEAWIKFGFEYTAKNWDTGLIAYSDTFGNCFIVTRPNSCVTVSEHSCVRYHL